MQSSVKIFLIKNPGGACGGRIPQTLPGVIIFVSVKEEHPEEGNLAGI